MNKKGTYMELIVLAGAILIFAVFMAVGHNITSSLNESMSSLNNTHVDNAFSGTSGVWDIFDYGLIFVMVGFALLLFVSAYYIRSNPFFFIFSLLGLMIVILVAVVYSNIFTSIMATEQFSAESTDLPISNYVMSYFPYFIFIIAVIFIIIFHSKTKNQGFEI